MGSLGTARDAIASRFATEIAVHYPSPFIVWPGEKAKGTPPAQDAPWFRFDIQPLRAEQPGVGAPTRLRDYAQVVIEIFTPPDLGDRSLWIAEARVRGIFAGYVPTAGGRFSDQRDMAPRFVPVGVVSDLGTWLKGIVIAPFRYDYTL